MVAKPLYFLRILLKGASNEQKAFKVRKTFEKSTAFSEDSRIQKKLVHIAYDIFQLLKVRIFANFLYFLRILLKGASNEQKGLKVWKNFEKQANSPLHHFCNVHHVIHQFDPTLWKVKSTCTCTLQYRSTLHTAMRLSTLVHFFTYCLAWFVLSHRELYT